VAQPLGCVCPGKKAPLAAVSPFLFFIFFFKKQKMEHQTELNPMTYWMLNPWKTYICPARLAAVPVSASMRKAIHQFSLLASFKAACINLQTQ
jgi:hypothetical protein